MFRRIVCVPVNLIAVLLIATPLWGQQQGASPSRVDEASSAKAAASSGEPSPTVAAELQKTIDQYIADYNSGQVDRVMAHWAENADFVDIRGRFHEGRDLIAALFRRGFAENPGRRLELQSASRKFLSPEVAMDDGILQLISADGDLNRGRYTVVWTKQDGIWLIRSARDIPIEIEPIASQDGPAPLQELAWLVGKWRAVSDQYTIDLECDWSLDESFLTQTFDVTSGDEKFRVVTYIGFDPSEGRFRSWYFDSRGGFGGGPWVTQGNAYRILTWMVLPDGRIGSSLMTWEPTDADTVLWQAMEREIGGELLPDSMQTYARVK